MFNNVLHQSAIDQLIEDISQKTLPQAMLFAGPDGSGKLTTALETARVLSCAGDEKGIIGEWGCVCPSCLRHKALIHTNVLILGSRGCCLEIEAAKKTFLEAVTQNASYVQATRYLFVRSVRKLTIRFNSIVWEGDDKFSKAAPILANIDELLEEIDPLRPILPLDELTKNVETLVVACKKLESSFMYDSIPIAHIRNASAWAHLTTNSDSDKKVLIIENADKMQESVSNALLKILEEPPENVIFILTAKHQKAIMPTILSRVRFYSFSDRTVEQHGEVLSRVFHTDSKAATVSRYLESFLPVQREKLLELACSYLLSIPNIPSLVRRIIMQRFNPRSAIPIEVIVDEANNFEPKILFTLFLKEIISILRVAIREKGITSQEQKIIFSWLKAVQSVSENVTLFNQNMTSALEYLSGELEKRSMSL